ncbi:MAG: hypothetical protein JXB14_00430 [Candidatus Altiarchaeota archaeon]|nr:hypothetical protein [Candidatus Altiarchaeota archaeon]
MKRKGWVVWVWGKMGCMLVFFGMLMILLLAYGYIASSTQADSSNQVSRDLRDILLDVYNSPDGLSFEYQIPETIDGEPYELEILNLTGDTVGIIARSNRGSMHLLGGASIALPLSDSSFRMVGGMNESVYLCITKHGGAIYIEKSKCS